MTEDFCSCRQPFLLYPVIVMCTNCKEWLRVDYERILKSAIDNEDIDFFVQDISEISKISKFSKQ